jgi:hypothetical protein
MRKPITHHFVDRLVILEQSIELRRPGTTAHQDLAEAIQRLCAFLDDPRPYRLYVSPSGLTSYQY